MNSRLWIWLVALGATSQALPQEFEAGTHYRVVSSAAQPTSPGVGTVELAEFFQYGCHACLSLEPQLERWLAEDKPDHVRFTRVHVTWNPQARLHAQAYYAAEALGKSEEMHAAFFDEIHKAGNSLDTVDKLAEFFARFSVARDDFTNAFNSFAVDTKLKRADELTRRLRVSGTPTIVVNGKYSTDGPMAGSYRNWFAILEQLIAAEGAGREPQGEP